jgi:hypothetical protein
LLGHALHFSLYSPGIGRVSIDAPGGRGTACPVIWNWTSLLSDRQVSGGRAFVLPGATTQHGPHGRGTGPGTAAHWEAQPPVVAQGAAAALRTRPLPQPTASSLVVETICFFRPAGTSRHPNVQVAQQQNRASTGYAGPHATQPLKKVCEMSAKAVTTRPAHGRATAAAHSWRLQHTASAQPLLRISRA